MLDLPKMFLFSGLVSLDIFSLDITTEDKIRTISYMQNQKRIETRLNIKNENSWLESLETKVTLNEVSKSNFNRYLQLLNKTNQFNVRTRRFTNIEFQNWLSLNENKAITLRLEDKFGDLGIIGLLGYKINNENLYVEDFVLSCRAAGRSLEQLMIYLLYEKANSYNISRIIIEALKTEKNKPIINFLNNYEFLEKKENLNFEKNLRKN